METENKKPGNPRAYPDPMRGAEQSYSNQSPWQLESGMTLRDYFAAKAMQSFTNIWYEDAKNTPESIAKKSYKLADAMLKQREL